MSDQHELDTRPPAAAGRGLRNAVDAINRQVQGNTTGPRWRIDAARTKQRLVRQMEQMNDQVTALRAQIAGLESRNRGLRRQVDSLTRGLHRRTVMAESLAEILETLEMAASALRECQAGTATEAIADTLDRIAALSHRLRQPREVGPEGEGA